MTLSLWLSRGTRGDLFSRNVLSGGRFTLAARKAQELGQPGDVAAAHPLAFAFTTLFAVECKHWRDLNLSQYITAPPLQSKLGRMQLRAIDDAHKVGLDYMLIAKSNFQPAIVVCSADVGNCMQQAASSRRSLQYYHHLLYADTPDACALLTLDTMLNVNPQKLLEQLGQRPGKVQPQ